MEWISPSVEVPEHGESVIGLYDIEYDSEGEWMSYSCKVFRYYKPDGFLFQGNYFNIEYWSPITNIPNKAKCR